MWMNWARGRTPPPSPPGLYLYGQGLIWLITSLRNCSNWIIYHHIIWAFQLINCPIPLVLSSFLLRPSQHDPERGSSSNASTSLAFASFLLWAKLNIYSWFPSYWSCVLRLQILCTRGHRQHVLYHWNPPVRSLLRRRKAHPRWLWLSSTSFLRHLLLPEKL